MALSVRWDSVVKLGCIGMILVPLTLGNLKTISCIKEAANMTCTMIPVDMPT